MRTAPTRLALLETVGLLEDLTPRQLRQLATHTDESTVAAGTVLIREGMLNRHAYFVVSGTLDVLVGDRLIATVNAGSVVGERAALRRELANATVIASSDAHVLAVHHQALLGAMSDSRTLRTRLLDMVDRRDAEHAA